MKAKYIGRHIVKAFGEYVVYLEYEYRGHTYVVEDNRTFGNKPLAQQHRDEQGRIDFLIAKEEAAKKKALSGA